MSNYCLLLHFKQFSSPENRSAHTSNEFNTTLLMDTQLQKIFHTNTVHTNTLFFPFSCFSFIFAPSGQKLKHCISGTYQFAQTPEEDCLSHRTWTPTFSQSTKSSNNVSNERMIAGTVRHASKFSYRRTTGRCLSKLQVLNYVFLICSLLRFKLRAFFAFFCRRSCIMWT